ncbi:MAG: DUF998 domain-containing protein [Intrasporangium sp.]|uniref:DUF998 domain-containing protein n=1 Tax=Intrasporangium sp. TaxID=1925024 RepID=UPI002647D699|nr:DUF998 domain-containing protein [Intrasporangium sp.]MDN5797295.1 DUF998 domain-containing protein [Intrasporangium sp.]
MSTSIDRTRRLLTCGILAGPLFLLVVLSQAPARDGFDPATHPLSLLSLGPNGWVQTTNFLVAGLLTLAGAVGLRRGLRGQPAGTWGPLLIGCQGIALVCAGVFATDPADGFPPGIAPPATTTGHAVLHAVAPTIGGIALDLACLVFARAFHRRGQSGWAAYCLATLAADVAAAGAAGTTGDFRWLLTGAAVTWLWVSAVLAHVVRDASGLLPAPTMRHAVGVDGQPPAPTSEVRRPTGASARRRER